jgi:hypothetical protein
MLMILSFLKLSSASSTNEGKCVVFAEMRSGIVERITAFYSPRKYGTSLEYFRYIQLLISYSSFKNLHSFCLAQVTSF